MQPSSYGARERREKQGNKCQGNVCQRNRKLDGGHGLPSDLLRYRFDFV
jgi:hypothetical protein